MQGKTSRILLILEALLIAMPVTGMAILTSASALSNAIQYPHMPNFIAEGCLSLFSVIAIGSGWRLFIIYLRGGASMLQRQNNYWWVVTCGGALILAASLISNLLPPSPEYSAWWMFRLNFGMYIAGAPLFIPLCHLAAERFLRPVD